jgi:hypothetical protein
MPLVWMYPESSPIHVEQTPEWSGEYKGCTVSEPFRGILHLSAIYGSAPSGRRLFVAVDLQSVTPLVTYPQHRRCSASAFWSMGPSGGFEHRQEPFSNVQQFAHFGGEVPTNSHIYDHMVSP